MNRLAQWFSGLPPKRKRRLVLLGILAVVAGLFMLGYRPDPAPRRREAPMVRELTLDGESLGRAKYLDLQRQVVTGSVPGAGERRRWSPKAMTVCQRISYGPHAR